MYDRILQILREKVRTRQYVMTLHAEEEMDEDGLTIYDVERIILTGEIIERQKDKETAEWKYVIRGRTLTRSIAVVVSKIESKRKLIILTVYLNYTKQGHKLTF